MFAGSYRGCGNWVPKDDGREYPTRRTTPTATATIGSWQDWIPRRRLIPSSLPNHSTLCWTVYYYKGRLLLLSCLFCIAGVGIEYSTGVELTNQ